LLTIVFTVENNKKGGRMLIGKVVINGKISVKTGLQIGGTTTGLKIGGVDTPVIKDALGKPYIPGSSLKGKLRSLIEKKEGVVFNEEGIHQCDTYDKYKECAVCRIWGILGNKNLKGLTLTRLIVRDTLLDERSITKEMQKNLELEYTEVKMEIAIHRYTGESSLRSMERIPAGAVFAPLEIVYNVFEEDDKGILIKLFEAMELLEQDYLGGMGSRGYGKIKFENLKIYWNTKESYESGNINITQINDSEIDTPEKIVKNFEKIKEKIK